MLLSVIMGVYNEKKNWLEGAIKSILGQSFKDFEFIIILDNPKNKELENIILDFEKLDNRIIFIKNKKNIGLVNTLNKGIKISKGKYIVRMDADDISLGERFEKQLEVFKRDENLAMLGTRILKIDENDNLIKYKDKRPCSTSMIKEYAKYGNPIAHPTLMIKKSVLVEIGGYIDVPAAEDYYLVIRLLKLNYKIKNISDELLLYRIRKNSISRSNKNLQVKSHSFIKDKYIKNIEYSINEYKYKETFFYRYKNKLEYIIFYKIKNYIKN